MKASPLFLCYILDKLLGAINRILTTRRLAYSVSNYYSQTHVTLYGQNVKRLISNVTRG